MRPLPAKCSVSGCEATAVARGLCRHHYMRGYNSDYYARHRETILQHLRRYRPSRSKNVPINQSY